MAAAKNPFEDLESNDPAKVEACKVQIKEQFNKAKDHWLMTGLYDYCLRTQSLRIVDVIAVVHEPHDDFFLDKATQGLRSSNKLQHLTLLGCVVRKRPMWLYKFFQHQLFNELLEIFKNETDIVVIVYALLILNILIPLVPHLVGPILPKIFAVFRYLEGQYFWLPNALLQCKLAALNAKSTHYQDVQLVHLQISLYTLFHRLYGMFPVNFINFLRKEYMTTETYAVFSHTVKPMLDTVRVNHLLITGTEDWEKSPTRWHNIESHDIIMGCANLLMGGGSSYREQSQRVVYAPKSAFNCNSLLDGLKVTGKQTVAEYCKELGKGAEDPTLFSPSARFLRNGSSENNSVPIPLTPITRGYEVSSPYSEHEGSSPPETAVEATPETTPIPDRPTTTSSALITAARPLASLLKDSIQPGATVPINDRSCPSSPFKKESPMRYSAPEILLYTPSQPPTRKIDMMLADRNKVNEECYAVEMNSMLSSTIRITNDLTSKDRSQSVISPANTSSPPSRVSDRKENGTAGVEECDVATDSVDDFNICDLEKSGSPCSSGGLHMPDSKSLCNFAIHMKHMRSRHYSQCNSDSERFSPNNSPQDNVNYFKNSKVRRTNSCPEMKKSSPNSTTLSSDSPVLEERDENDEFYDHDKALSTRRKMKKSAPTKVTIETQTEDLASLEQFPYEHLFLDVFPPLCRSQLDEQASPTGSVNSIEERSPASVYEKANSPSKLLQKYIEATSQCYDDQKARNNARTPSLGLENKYLLDQLRLMTVQLQLEEYKREEHANRNRRLFHRSRRNKTLEEHNIALVSQVKALQKEIESSNEAVLKIVQEKKAQIEREKEKALFWRDEYRNLQKTHETMTSRCQKAEAHLKEEKDSNEQNLKQLNETKAILGDITNDLRSCQKDAMETKDLRHIVGELQREILKAGELITLYSNRLRDASLPIDDKNHDQVLIDSYSDGRKELITTINDQRTLLEATQKVLISLQQNIENKENKIEKLDEEMKSSRNSLQNTIQDWQKKYEDLKTLYDQEKIRSNEFEMQVNRFKLLMKSNQCKMAPQKDMTMRRGMIPLTEDGSGPNSGLKSSHSVPKSPKNVAHSAQQQLKTAWDNTEVTIPGSEANRVRTSPISDQGKERESPLRTKVELTQSPATFVARELSVDSDTATDVFKSITKKKARTECAESGQLRPISFTPIDPEPPSKKE